MTRSGQVVSLLRRSAGSDYIGEKVSQLEHALQAAHFAREAGAPDSAILAALLHDVGHLCAPEGAPQMAGLGVVSHEEIGARWLAERGFSSDVCELVRGHVQAKRYLVYRYPEYAARLSEASRGTLEFQGGAMTRSEAEEFERDPLFKLKLAVRAWDERAKVVGLEVPGLESYTALLDA
jgi:phosphonate degradation associated HDIG domain protein